MVINSKSESQIKSGKYWFKSEWQETLVGAPVYIYIPIYLEVPVYVYMWESPMYADIHTCVFKDTNMYRGTPI